MYTSHIRSEGSKLFEAVQELIHISRQTGIPVEIYHLKEAGKDNWGKLDSLLSIIVQARKEGIPVTADMYTYNRSATGLSASFPPTLQDGGFDKLWHRLQNKTIRESMKKAMNTNSSEWENTYYQAGGASGVLLIGFKRDSLKKYIGRTLAEVAAIRGKNGGRNPDGSDRGRQYPDRSRLFLREDENNVKKEVALPWVSFGSDAPSAAPEGVFLLSSAHPRGYGNFARVLGKFVREEKALSLPDAVYKLSKLPATNLKLVKRGELKTGYYADIVVFDPKKVQDHATYEKPQQYATGVGEVFVNGVQVIKNGEHTGATPGRFIKGPGYGKKLR